MVELNHSIPLKMEIYLVISIYDQEVKKKVVVHIELEDENTITSLHFSSSLGYNISSLHRIKRILLSKSSRSITNFLNDERFKIEEKFIGRYSFIANLLAWCPFRKAIVNYHCRKALYLNLFNELYEIEPKNTILQKYALLGDYNKYGYLRHDWRLTIDYLNTRFSVMSDCSVQTR
jgi:uncharacterized protein with ParB-like and HNH nuclease domain